MKRHFLTALGLSVILVLCSCSRERISIEQMPDKTDDYVNEVREDKMGNSEKKHETPIKFRPNPFAEIYSENEECTRFSVYFEVDESKENVEKKWNEICNLPDIIRTQVATFNGGTFDLDLKYVNPSYYEYYIAGDEEIRKTFEDRGFMEFSAEVVASDAVDEITMCVYRDYDHSKHGFKDKQYEAEEWPYCIEENDVIIFKYVDSLGNYLSQDITIQKIIPKPPWYLDGGISETACIIVPEAQYREMFGEDKNCKNICDLEGDERFFLQCEEGKIKETKRRIDRIGVSTSTTAGFYKED